MHGILAKPFLSWAQIHPLLTPITAPLNLSQQLNLHLHLAKMQKVVTY